MNRFHYSLAVLLLVCAVSCTPAPKRSISDWGSPVDPDEDCKIVYDRSALTIEIPGGDHDYDHRRERLNAPRLMREFEGDFEFQVRVRIDCRASAASSVKGQLSYVSAGFLVTPIDDSINLLRVEYKVEGRGDGVDGSVAYDAMNGGTSGAISLKQLANWPLKKWPIKGKPDYIYQRLERWNGGAVSYSFSLDGNKWVTLAASYPLEVHAKFKVGLLACSTSTDPFEVRFDRLKIIRGKKRRTPWDFVSAWGNPVDPDKDCKIQREKDSLTIEMPGRDHDYDPHRKRFNAPRLLFDLEDRFDMQFRVRIDYRPTAQSTVNGQPSFVSAGFLLIYPDDIEPPYVLDICARSEFAVSQHGSKPDAYAIAPRLAQPRRKNPSPKEMAAEGFAVMKEWFVGQRRKNTRIEWDRGMPPRPRASIWERGWQNWPLPEKTEYAYLRLYHRESGASFYISPDGEKWTYLGSMRSLPENGKLALAAYSTSTEPSTVCFDQLKLWRENKKSQ